MSSNTYTEKDFCWLELHTDDTAKAGTFYSELFGWQIQELFTTPEGSYSMLMNGKAGVGGMSSQMPDLSDRNFWLTYVYVSDAEACAARVNKAGGEVVFGPADVAEVGRMGIVRDPEGALVAFIQLISSDKGEANPLNSHCWSEVACRDIALIRDFYSQVFEWDTEDMDMGEDVKYTMFKTGDISVGGVMEMSADWGDMPSHWMSYIAVEDCDASAARCKELGGEVCVPPTDIPPIGRFSVINDPTGATISIIKLSAGQD